MLIVTIIGGGGGGGGGEGHDVKVVLHIIAAWFVAKSI